MLDIPELMAVGVLDRAIRSQELFRSRLEAKVHPPEKKES
jgi:hypothetical protein